MDRAESGKVAFLFPGQGSQQVGMGKALADRFPEARRTFREADEVLGFSLSGLCFEGTAESLTETAITQPAIFATSIAALRALRKATGGALTPAYLAGHSLGEYSALAAGGALPFADALRLVRLRGQFMSEAGQTNPGGMVAVIGLEARDVAQVCSRASENGGVVQIANDNAPGQVVISGDVPTLDCAMELAKSLGARRVIRLAVSIAAHSALMTEAARRLHQAVSATHFHVPHIPVVGNVQALPLPSVRHVREELVRQLTTPVRWTDTIRYLVQQGVNQFVEVGPGSVLAGLVKRIAPDALAFSVGDLDSLALLCQTLKLQQA